MFDGYQDVNNNRISDAAAVLIDTVNTYYPCTALKSICLEEKPLRFSSGKRI